MRIAIIVTAVMFGVPTLFGGEVYKNQSAAEKALGLANNVKTGVPLPAASGAKPGRILPLLDSAKRRFGAGTAKVRYDGQVGKVDIFLFDCQAMSAREVTRHTRIARSAIPTE